VGQRRGVGGVGPVDEKTKRARTSGGWTIKERIEGWGAADSEAGYTSAEV